MARIQLCFLWHMHQPFYKNLVSGEYRLPWTRLHALKDYYGMAKLLEEFPAVRQTFNLVPSMLVQVDEYARGVANEPLLNSVLRPVEEMSEWEQKFLLENSFHASSRLIYRFPRYGELHDAWQASHRDPGRARRSLGPPALRDLQVLSQLAWFDEEFLEKDGQVQELVRKGRNFSRGDQEIAAAKQREILGLVLPTYWKLAAAGQIEISTTPFYHPILPLVCDSDIASVTHPNVTLPARFRYPQDARRQLEMARDYILKQTGQAPAGLWPSEGSVSDEVFAIAAECGFRWAATDNGVLDRTLGRGAGVEGTYRSYEWRQENRSMHVIFRDHVLSDLIGFVYSKMGPAEAAEDFLRRIRENCRGILASGRDALVPIILDGENAWEYFEQNGRPFLRELYGRISRDPEMTALTVSEALARTPAEPLGHIHPGSWINANFDIWIGAEEDNRAWEYLRRAREAYAESASDTTAPAGSKNLELAFEELLIAEGSDWCWWYGPEHDSPHRAEFDQLYRDHLATVYRALGLKPPEELSRPILSAPAAGPLAPPTGRIQPVIDGAVTSFFEWLGAGVYDVDSRSGSMHEDRRLVRQLRFGTDGAKLYLRLDFSDPDAAGSEVRLTLEGDGGQGSAAFIRVQIDHEAARVAESTEAGVECAWGKLLELAVPLARVSEGTGAVVKFHISLWQDGLPMDALPKQGWLEVPIAPPAECW